MKTKVKKSYHPIGLKTSSLVIAIAQLEGPEPKGKRKTVIGNRESFEWQSLAEINSRIRKACNILDELNKLSKKPDIVVFPEYSLPVEKALPQLQEKANLYGQIIIAGADSVNYAKLDKIYNQCPIIIPGRKKPLRVTKQKLSQWEKGLIDQPTQVTFPVLTWQADGRDYWIVVHICMDFLLAPLDRTRGSGIFIVPMCSPETNTFRVYADTLLRAEFGTATVLCNCVGGEIAEGRSGVTAIVPGSGPLRPALDLPESKEVVAVFEIDCKRLSPPKKSVPGINPPLGKRQLFSLHTTPLGVEFIPLTIEDDGEIETVRRAVINPTIFELLGKKMRMAFLEVAKYASISDTIKDQDFEVLAILGHHDVLVTHLHEDRHDMIFDITQAIPLRNLPSETVDHKLRESFPFFRVDVFYKVLGSVVTGDDRAVFDGPDKPVPSLRELTQILRLGTNWNDEDVPEVERNKFVERRWILDSTMNQPGKISSVMTISLDYASGNIGDAHSNFEERVVPELVNKRAVTSLYRGRPHNLSMHYVLRVTSDVDSLFSLIDEVHHVASKAKILVTTTTYVVVKKMSNLSLEKAVLLPVIPADEANYRNTHIHPRLSDEDRVRAIYLPQSEQRTYIQRFRLIQEDIAALGDRPWLQGRRQKALNELAKGLLHDDFADLKEAHDLLQTRVERMLADVIEKEVSDADLNSWRSSINISPGKKRNFLTYAERIVLCAKAIEERNLGEAKLTDVRDLTLTREIRNALAHGDWKERLEDGKISVETYIDSVRRYCAFIQKWDT